MFVFMFKYKRGSIVFLFYFILTLVLYFESRYSGFVTDYIGFEQNYDLCGFWHYYECSGGKNFRYLQHAFSFILYKNIGSDTIIWYFLYALAHTLTAFLLYKVIIKIITGLNSQHQEIFAFIIALLFLVSPYQSEVVVWRVCIQYCTISICLLLAILLALKDFEKPRWKYPIMTLILFVIGLLSIEQIVVLPYFILLIFMFYCISKNRYANIKRIFFAYFLPQHILIALYFYMSKIIYGKWIMHYGENAYGGFLTLKTISKIYQYFFKYILLVRYWEHNSKTAFFNYLEAPIVTIILSVILSISVGFLIIRFIKGSVYSGLMVLFIGLYIVSLFPVIQLYFSTLLYVENDRLGYLSSMFIFGLCILVLIKFNFRIFVGCAIIIITVNVYYTLKMSHYWKRSTQIYNAYLNNFNTYEYRNVYLLGVPDNYKGIWMMRIYGQNSSFKEALQYRHKKPYIGNMYDVLFFNQISFDDGMSVSKQNDSTLNVNFKHFGSWLWNQGIGATDYETQQYIVKINEYGYTITFNNFNKENSIILYPDKLKWIPVQM